MTYVVTAILAIIGTLLAQRFLARRMRRAATAAVDELQVTLGQGARELEEQRAEAARQARRADEYFGKIASVVKEAEDARKLYRDSAVEHGAAQAMLMREIERVAMAYSKLAVAYREKTQESPPPLAIDPTVRKVAEAFKADHVG